LKGKRIAWIALVVAAVLVLSCFIATGFNENPNVALVDYTLSEDGREITLHVGVMTSIGYIRGFRDSGGGVKPHYLTFYSCFGGINSSLGAKRSFTLSLSGEDSQIYFNRAGGGYELVLEKDEITGQWLRPARE